MSLPLELDILKEEDLGGYKRITGEFWTARQRQMHSIHYAVSYRASFKPELPDYFIRRYCSDPLEDLVLDPFGGRGTTILQANVLGFAGFSNDVNPLSERIARPKTRPVSLREVKDALDRIDFEDDVVVSDYPDLFTSISRLGHPSTSSGCVVMGSGCTSTSLMGPDFKSGPIKGGCSPKQLLMHNLGYDAFEPFYHIDTYKEILALRRHLKTHRSDADRFIEMIALSRLHGHSNGFFSVYSFPQISVTTTAQARINKRRNQTPDYRPVKPRIMRKARRVLSDFTEAEIERLRPVSERNVFTCEDSRDMRSIPDEAVALIVTSPPFLNMADYVQDNWLEFWFLGIDAGPLRGQIVQTNKLVTWSEFMRGSLREMLRALRPNGRAVVEVGEVRSEGRIVNLDEVVADLALEVGFRVDEVLINLQTFTKLANCFNVDNMKKGTNTNRLVVLGKR